jgi:hypothetical protein
MFDVPRIKRCETKPYSFESLNPEKPFVLHTRPLAQTRNELVLRFSVRESQTMKDLEAANERLRVAREATTRPPKEETLVALALATNALDRALDLRAMDVIAHCCVPSWENVTESGVAVDCTPENVLRFLRFMYAPAEEQGAGRADDVKLFIAWASHDTFSEPLKDGETLGKA